MEAHQQGGNWVPITPIKPSLNQPRSIYDDGQIYIQELDDHLSRFSHQNQIPINNHHPQNPTTNNFLWEEKTPLYHPHHHHHQHHSNNNHSVVGSEQNVGLLHRWRSSAQSSSLPNLNMNTNVNMNLGMNVGMNMNNAWEMPPANSSGIREEFDESMAQFNSMSFVDLLAMKGSSSLAPSTTNRSGSLFSSWDSQSDFINFGGQISSIHGGQMQSGGGFPTFHDQNGNLSLNHLNSPLGKLHANGNASTFAPPTPDIRLRPENGVDRPPNEGALVVNLEGDNSNNTNAIKEVTDSTIAVEKVPEENHNPDKNNKEVVVEGGGGIDLNKTPLNKKPRRKRYTPKVVREDKPRKTPKPKTPKPTDPKETPRAKRKYVRKNKVNPPPNSTPPPPAAAEGTETSDPKPTEEEQFPSKTCRKSLNFDLNENGGPAKDDCGGVQLDWGEELTFGTSDPGNLNQAPNSSPCASSNEEAQQNRGSKRGHDSGPDFSGAPPPPPGVVVPPETHKKKKTADKTAQMSQAGEDVSQSSNNHHHQHHQQHHQHQHHQHHQHHHHDHHSTVVDSGASSKYYYCNPPQAVGSGNSMAINRAAVIMRNVQQSRVQFVNTWADIDRLKTKKRPTKAVPPATPAPKCPPRTSSSNNNKVEITSDGSYVNLLNSMQQPCMEEAGNTPGAKRGPKKQTNLDKGNKQQWDIVLYGGGDHSVSKKKGRPSSRKKTDLMKESTVEAITERLKTLDINKVHKKQSSRRQGALVPYRAQTQDQNALVVYRQEGGGAIVPFEGPFEPIRKRRTRAKVDLDDETTRVWRLLLENIDNQGIDGTDEEKVKWWENERSVFHGRVDSFIARMRLVQGDRRFTPWKGSVLDSVIGVFLTQNVSDHLSSSAFMAMAAQFPIKPDRNTETSLSEEAMSALVVEPEICIVEPEESISWTEKGPICDRNSTIIHSIDNGEEEKEVRSVDYYCESSQKGTSESRVVIDKASSPNARDDATSSLQSVISSQNSVSSPNFQAVCGAQASRSSSKSNNYFDCSTSFMGLLKMAEKQIPGQDQQAPLEAASTSSNWQFNQQPIDFHLRASKYIEILEAESRSSDASRKDENSPPEQSNLIDLTAQQHFAKEKGSGLLDDGPRSFGENAGSCYVLEGGKMVSEKAAGPPTWKRAPHLPEVTGSTTTGVEGTRNYQKGPERAPKHGHAGTTVALETNAGPGKPKGKPGKEKKKSFDWDSLRRHAQADNCSRMRERPANTRDSIDWEAVRHADVSEIANTIKARGMNNMLAERIKELLDRLVTDHGSVDMEWLRDVPPDKAKEYLLSFRGLGLKSVECVRLLTLHHLAFPVDTNVGRIAVRLGWVPLQPLPESLQLHLLEMYPVLESIQKYLWPRLCKLDQKTLYELHYHLITFGKVFCTKRSPNCNACPLRGECRHFASAFASARLALPGPEERSIMAPTGATSHHPMHPPQPNLNPLPLPPLSGNFPQLEASRTNADFSSSIVEVPSTPLSFPPPPHHQTSAGPRPQCEPIVEVPASPEPEPEPEPTLFGDIEDALFAEDPDEIPTIQLNMKEFTQTLENFMHAKGEIQEAEMSKALVALTPEVASLPTPKLKNISRLRTEHHVYELPDTHPLIKEMDRREPDDPCSYLLAIWTPGETANSVEPPERRCNFDDPNILCNEVTCSYCSSQREANSQIVRGTLLIPCRTAMRGSFPLNGTYFQVNEVFADHDSSLNPIDVPRSWLWNLPRRTVYFGTSIPTIFRGLTTEEIQHCFWRGYVCVRGFDQKSRAPRPLMARLHFPASKMTRGGGGKGKGYADDE